jgi:hypothetical protein
MSKMIHTDPEGLILPDGTSYSWNEVAVTLEVTAHIKMPDGKDMTMTGHCEGPDTVKWLVDILNKTAGEQEPLQ